MTSALCSVAGVASGPVSEVGASPRDLASDAAIVSDAASASGSATGWEALAASVTASVTASACGTSDGGGAASAVSAAGAAGASVLGAALGALDSCGVAAGPSSALILSHTAGDGSTASTITLSSTSRRSHWRTESANPGSISSSASACSRSSAESVPSTYSAASASWASSYITGFVPFLRLLGLSAPYSHEFRADCGATMS